MKKTAHILKKDLLTGVSVQWHVRLEPPLLDSWSNETYEYVLVSAANVYAFETYIFPSDETGKVTSWSELAGSQKGTVDHRQVLKDMGYEIDGGPK
jgi:hypothetical protein